MSFLFGALVGFAIGYFVFERPQLMTDLINAAKEKLRG